MTCFKSKEKLIHVYALKKKCCATSYSQRMFSTPEKHEAWFFFLFFLSFFCKLHLNFVSLECQILFSLNSTVGTAYQ